MNARSSEIPFTTILARHWRKSNPVPVQLVAVALVTIGRCQSGVLVNRWAGPTVAKVSVLESLHVSEVMDTSLNLSAFPSSAIVFFQKMAQREKHSPHILI